MDSSIRLLREAIRADTTFLPAFHEYLYEMVAAGRMGDLRREFPEPPSTAGVFAQCRSGMARTGFSGDYVVVRPLLRRLESLPDATGCKAAFIARGSSVDQPEQQLAKYREALSYDPEWLNVWTASATILNTLGKRDEAGVTLLEGLRRLPHPLHSLALQLQLVGQREAMGDSAAARRLFAAIGTSVARDGRPYLRRIYLERVGGEALQTGNIARWDSVAREQVEIARNSRAAAAEYRSVESWGATLAFMINDPKGAIVPLTRAAVLADSIAAPEFITSAYLARGRAFAKLGEFRRAEQDLRRALTAVPADGWTRLAEIHHDLAHAYEGQGRWAEAVREVDLYSRYAWHVREGSALYMMSLRDAGVIRWKAGWHAAAGKSFEEMVRIIDERKANHFYAGEYYERIGDFSRAASYYSRGAGSEDTGDRHLNLAGLTRMYQALGLTDSARVAATLHDRPGPYSVSRLLPGALVADGRVNEGIGLARTDVAEREAKGAPLHTATAILQLARLLLDAGRPAEAGREAERAERIAAASQLAEHRIEALQLQGIAQRRSGSSAAIATLLHARKLLQIHSTPALRMKVETTLGEALAASGRSAESLIAFDRAAAASDRVTSSFESALDRARNRDEKVAPFNGALGVLLRMPESSDRSARLFAWSTRKKNALSRQNASVGEDSIPRAATLANTQRMLDTRTAIVDYIVVDSAICALVITARGSHVLKLPLSVITVSEIVRQLRRPLVSVDAGQLDLARAPFDLGLAGRLYVGLFAPLEQSLGGADRVVIVPDGPMHGVPFAALPVSVRQGASTDAYHATQYLIDRYIMVIAGSAALTSAPRSALVAGKARVLAVRGSVDGGDAEVQSIVAAWPRDRVTSLEGAAATEVALRRNVAGRAIIHFAVHARADERDPLASYLEVAGNGTDDGFLHVNEVAALKFRGDLVVLTGCETMPGRVFAGTGPFGIANSFIAAGAQSVIATHWPVGESAATLSGELHRALARGVQPSEALRVAQLTLRRDPARAHPFYWGAYVLVSGGTP